MMNINIIPLSLPCSGRNYHGHDNELQHNRWQSTDARRLAGENTGKGQEVGSLPDNFPFQTSHLQSI